MPGWANDGQRAERCSGSLPDPRPTSTGGHRPLRLGSISHLVRHRQPCVPTCPCCVRQEQVSSTGTLIRPTMPAALWSSGGPPLAPSPHSHLAQDPTWVSLPLRRLPLPDPPGLPQVSNPKGGDPTHPPPHQARTSSTLSLVPVFLSSRLGAHIARVVLRLPCQCIKTYWDTLTGGTVCSANVTLGVPQHLGGAAGGSQRPLPRASTHPSPTSQKAPAQEESNTPNQKNLSPRARTLAEEMARLRPAWATWQTVSEQRRAGGAARWQSTPGFSLPYPINSSLAVSPPHCPQ